MGGEGGKGGGVIACCAVRVLFVSSFMHASKDMSVLLRREAVRREEKGSSTRWACRVADSSSGVSVSSSVYGIEQAEIVTVWERTGICRVRGGERRAVV